MEKTKGKRKPNCTYLGADVPDELAEQVAETVKKKSAQLGIRFYTSDAQELSHNADAVRVAELAKLKSLVENAEFVGETENVEHKKFEAFSYYRIEFVYGGKSFDVLFNVGRAINDKKYHIYAITKYNEKGAVGLLKNNPSRPVGNAIKDGSFNNSISENREMSILLIEKVKKFLKCVNRRTRRKEC